MKFQKLLLIFCILYCTFSINYTNLFLHLSSFLPFLKNKQKKNNIQKLLLILFIFKVSIYINIQTAKKKSKNEYIFWGHPLYMNNKMLRYLYRLIVTKYLQWFTWDLMICRNWDISSGHSNKKWKWSKITFGFLK